MRKTTDRPARHVLAKPLASPAWERALSDWLDYLAAKGWSESGIYLRTWQLRCFARDWGEVGPWALTPAMVVSWLAGQAWKPATRRSYRACLRGFYGWAMLAGHLEGDPTVLLGAVPVPLGVPRPTPNDAIRDALGKADPRLRLMILLASMVGLRRAEIARVHTGDIEDGHVRVRGKGGRVRVLPLAHAVLAALEGRPAGYLFPGKIDGHLSPEYVGKLLSRAFPPGRTAHTLRHRFATAAYGADRDLVAVQTLLGHASIATTQIYAAVPPGALRAAVNAAGDL